MIKEERMTAEEEGEPWLYCPITHEIFIEPVVTRFGHTFEATALREWLTTHHTCPLTKQPLVYQHDVFPCHTLRDAVAEYRRRHHLPAVEPPPIRVISAPPPRPIEAWPSELDMAFFHAAFLHPTPITLYAEETSSPTNEPSPLNTGLRYFDRFTLEDEAAFLASSPFWETLSSPHMDDVD